MEDLSEDMNLCAGQTDVLLGVLNDVENVLNELFSSEEGRVPICVKQEEQSYACHFFHLSDSCNLSESHYICSVDILQQNLWTGILSPEIEILAIIFLRMFQKF